MSRRRLAAGFAAALALRLLMLALVAYRTDAGDSSAYDRMGENLAVHGVDSEDAAPPYRPSLVRAPLLPLELAAVYTIAGHRPLAASLLQALLTSAACLLLAVAVERRAPGLGPWALWILALSPFDAVFAGAILAEALCTTFLIIAMSVPVLNGDGRGRLGWLACGVALGAVALGRDIYMLLPVAVALALVAARGRRRFLAAALVLAGAACAIAPWTARNRAATGSTVLISRGLMWYNLWIGTWERNGDWEAPTLLAELPREAWRDEPERRAVESALRLDEPVAADRAFRALTLDRLRSEPLRVFGRWLRRAPRMWIGTRFDLFSFRPSLLARGKPAWWALKLAFAALDVALVGLALVGLALALRARSSLLWFALPLLYQQAIYLPFHNVETRFTQPVFPFLLVFASLAARALAARLHRRQPRMLESTAHVEQR